MRRYPRSSSTPMSPVCSQPSASIGVLGRLVVVEVAAHHVVAADEHLARLPGRQRAPAGVDDRDLDPGHGGSAGGGDGLGVVVGPAHRRGAGGLREPVGGEHRLQGQLLVQPLDQRDRHGGGAGDGHPQAAQVVPVPARVVQDRRVERGRAGQHGDPFPLDEAQRGVHVEDRLRHHRRAAQQARHHAGLVAERVGERVDQQVAVARPQAGQLAPGHVQRDPLPVGEHRALRVPGGAGGEEDVADVVRWRRRPRWWRRCPASTSAPPARNASQPWFESVLVDDGRGEVGQVLAGQHPDVVGAEEPVDGHEQPDRRLAQDVRGLGALVAGVQRHHDRAGPYRAQRGDDPPPAVRGPQRHPVAGFDARPRRARGRTGRRARRGRRR